MVAREDGNSNQMEKLGYREVSSVKSSFVAWAPGRGSGGGAAWVPPGWGRRAPGPRVASKLDRKEVTPREGDRGRKCGSRTRSSLRAPCPHRGAQQAHHGDSGGAAEPERAPRSGCHLHLHSQEQGGLGRAGVGSVARGLGTFRVTLTPTPAPKSPAYTLVWTRLHNGKLPSGAMDFNGILTIRNVQLSDAGTYVCTGSNMFAMDQGTATLHVQGSPSPPRPASSPAPLLPTGLRATSSRNGSFLSA